MLRILQISDPHLFADTNATLLNLNTLQSFEAVLQKAASDYPHPDLIVLSGDLSQDFSEQAYWHAAKACGQYFSCPIFWLAGNHDAPLVMQKILPQTQLREDKAIVLNNWLLVLLNTHCPKRVEGHLGRAELTRLEYYLSLHPDKHVLIFLHHPPLLVGSSWLDKSILNNPEDLFAVTDKYSHVRAMVCGHVHQVFEAERRGVPVLTTPSTCIQFLPGSRDFALDTASPGYRWLELLPNGQFVTGVVRLESFVNTADFAAEGY